MGGEGGKMHEVKSSGERTESWEKRVTELRLLWTIGKKGVDRQLWWPEGK